MSMFKNAAPVQAPAKAASKKSDKAEFQMAGMLAYSQIDALIKSLQGLQETYRADLDGAALDTFMAQANGKRPDSFCGVEGIASASVELKKRSTASKVSDDELVVLTKAGLPVQKVVATQKCFVLNPKYSENMEVLSVIEKNLDGKVPADLIQVQEEVSKHVVTDDTLDTAFRIGAPREIIQMITTLSMKPKLEEVNIEQIVSDVTKLLLPKKVKAKKADVKAA